MLKTRLPFMLLLALTLFLSACNPRQDTPPPAQNLVTEAPLGNYDGGDETIYFLVTAPDGTQKQFEAGFIKDGKLTLNAVAPPAALQHRWLDTLPDGVTGLEYSEGAEEAMAVHVTAILIGDTGLMVTGVTGLAPASNDGESFMVFAGLTWTSHQFDASYYLEQSPADPTQFEFDDFTAFARDAEGRYSNQDVPNFFFDADLYLNTDLPDGGLSHPFFPPVPLPPAPGDEDPGDEEPGDEDPVGPTELKAVIASPVGVTALVEEPVTFSADGSTGEGELTFEWKFGYGAEPRITTEQTFTHAYPAAGTFTITLTVRDGKGETDDATTSITIMEREPNLVTHKVEYYTGPAGTVSVQTSLREGGVASFPIGTIDTTGLMTLDLSTPAPSEYLLSLSDAFQPGTFTNPDASILIPLEQFAFINDATPLTRFLAVDSMSSRGFYMYADQAVNINVPLDMPGLMPADLQLQAGWNFVTPESRDDGEILVNGDPKDFSWIALIMPPERQIESITLSPEEWTGHPGESGRVLSVQAHYDDDSDEPVYSDITWSSSDENIARIVPVGHEFAVQPVSYGTAIITAEWRGVTATMTAIVDTVITDTAPPHNVDVWAIYPVGPTGIPTMHNLGLLTSEGHLTFNNIDAFELTPITETPVINAAYADDQTANMVFVQSIITDIEASGLWIGDPVNFDHSSILGNKVGHLWYSDRPVKITHEGPDTEHTYDVSLVTGWNLVTLTTKSTGENTAYHFENAAMDSLPWFYEEQDGLVIEMVDNRTEGTPEAPYLDFRAYRTYPYSGAGYLFNNNGLHVESSNFSVASVTLTYRIQIRGNGEAEITFSLESRYPTTVTVTGTGFPG